MFRRQLRIAPKDISDLQIIRLFKALDQNGGGTICVQELVSFMAPPTDRPTAQAAALGSSQGSLATPVGSESSLELHRRRIVETLMRQRTTVDLASQEKAWQDRRTQLVKTLASRHQKEVGVLLTKAQAEHRRLVAARDTSIEQLDQHVCNAARKLDHAVGLTRGCLKQGIPLCLAGPSLTVARRRSTSAAAGVSMHIDKVRE